jgi:hypothetical protein
MTDIKQIANECASRIMDRMEMCRGSAILKDDIAREVEIALRQVQPAPTPKSIVEKALKHLDERWVSHCDAAVRELNEQQRQGMLHGNWSFASAPEYAHFPPSGGIEVHAYNCECIDCGSRAKEPITP